MTLRLFLLAVLASMVGCAGATNGKVAVDHPIYEYRPDEDLVEPEEPDEPEEPEEPDEGDDEGDDEEEE